MWTGADAKDRGLVDGLGGLQTAITRAKIRAGLAADTEVRVLNYPGSSVLDMLRPKASSQPAAASVPHALGALVAGSVTGIIDQVERTVNGAHALWVGDLRL